MTSEQASAVLTSVPGLDAAHAEALIAGHIDTVEGLAAAAFDDLARAFRRAVDNGRLETEPEPAVLLNLSRAANRIHLGGTAVGTVRDAQGQAIEGAVVEVSTGRAHTDATGFFRILGLPPLPRHGCRVLIGSRVVLVRPAFPVLFGLGNGNSVGPVLVLGEPLPPPLDEFDGAVLPPLGGLTTRSRRMPNDLIRDGDVIVVTHHYSTSPSVRVVSVFRAVSKGEIVVRHARVGLDRFPGGTPTLGTTFRVRGMTFRRVAGGPSALEIYRAHRRVVAEARAQGELTMGPTLEEAILGYGRALGRHHLLAGRLQERMRSADQAGTGENSHG